MQHTCKYICNGLLTWRYWFQEINEVRGQNAAVELRTFLFQRFQEPQLNVHIYWFYRQVWLSVISIQVNICFILSNNILIALVVLAEAQWKHSTLNQFFLTTLFRKNVGFVSLIFFFLRLLLLPVDEAGSLLLDIIDMTLIMWFLMQFVWICEPWNSPGCWSCCQTHHFLLKVTGKCCQWNWATSAMTMQ